MHDKLGRPLAVGDMVLVPCKITNLSPGEDYCNVSVETIYGRRPDDAKETMSAINTGVMLRANAGDTNNLDFSEPAASAPADEAAAPAEGDKAE